MTERWLLGAGEVHAEFRSMKAEGGRPLLLEVLAAIANALLDFVVASL